MKTDQQKRKYLSEYSMPDFTITRTGLQFELDAEHTRVNSSLSIKRQGKPEVPLVLDGVELKLCSIAIDGVSLAETEYKISTEKLTVYRVPDEFELRCEVEINPVANTRLEGLYLSNGNFCTQCEAEGFRYITYYIDRPDVMSVFSTRISGDKSLFPVLLSNGNRIESGVDGDTHWVEWHDPFPKPSYLFALVAGDLACIEGGFTTMSGRQVTLQIYTEHHNREKCGHAMTSLQKAMRWDEEVFGLEYDLDLYMVVAVDDFNMGAMENKGLNVFNTKYVLANSKTATDDDFLGIESVIAHEYFHNWTGNRVTCRDWFQLSLKEGLTVFRDQEFSSDMGSRAIQRISDVRVLRNHQFPEDAGPMAHPVRPAYYQEINNFYTSTVYNKGAEVVRMMHTLLGAENFRKGMDLYFARHDGQAVTTDDFRAAMQDASSVDLSQFQRWYEQSGTPAVEIERIYHAQSRQLELLIKQYPGHTKGKTNSPFHMPMRLSLFDQQGRIIELDEKQSLEWTVDITQHEHKLVFENISEKPVFSAFREFSAPINLKTDLADDEMALLMTCDTDPFNQWEACQQYASRIMLNMYQSAKDSWPKQLGGLMQAFGQLLGNDSIDPALVAEMMVLPGEKYLAELLDSVDIHLIREVREAVRSCIAIHHEQTLLGIYNVYAKQREDNLTPEVIAQRRLKNTCLAYLLTLDKEEYFQLCLQQYESAVNMTDQMGCLVPVVNYQNDIRRRIVDDFYQQWQDTALVVDKWFSAQGASYADDALEVIVDLFDHPAYTLNNPNRARSLLGALIANSSAFHRVDGSGYHFVADRIMALDSINPQVAARMANAFVHWKRFIPQQGELMKIEIERMLSAGGLSNDLYELLATSLED
jgi:aminopeptidase N